MTVPTVPPITAQPVAEYAVTGWEAPVPLDTGAAPPFPVGALPDVFRDYVSALAALAEVPPDLPGILTLGVTAAAIARKVWTGTRSLSTSSRLSPCRPARGKRLCSVT